MEDDFHTWLLMSIYFYCIVLLVYTVQVVVTKRASLIEPIPYFLFFNSLFTLPLPIRLLITHKIEGNVSPLLFDFIDYIHYAVFFSAISIPFFYAGYYSRFGERIAKKGPTIRSTSSIKNVFVAILIGVFSLFLLSRLAGGLSALPRFILLGYGSTAQTFGSGYLAVGFPWLFVATMFVWVAYAISRRRIWFIVGSIGLAGNLGMQLVMGSRGMMLYILVTFGVFFLIQIKYLRWKTILIVGLAGFLALNIIGHTRKSDYQSFDDFVDKTLQAGGSSLSQSNEGLFYTLTIGEFVVPFETFPQMIRIVGPEITPWVGWSYIRAPIFLIPTVVFPSRPVPLTSWYMEQFYGQIGHYNEGRAFFWLAEAYLNFGPVGIVLIAMLWGVGWRVWYEWLRQCNYDPAAAMIYALGVGFMFRCIAGMFDVFVAGFTQQSLIPAVGGMLLSGTIFVIRRRPKDQVVAAQQPAE